MSKTTNKFSPEVRNRAIRMVLDHEAEHPSRRAAVSSIAANIGCSPPPCTSGSRRPRSTAASEQACRVMRPRG
jgi:transposase-like protein